MDTIRLKGWRLDRSNARRPLNFRRLNHCASTVIPLSPNAGQPSRYVYTIHHQLTGMRPTIPQHSPPRTTNHSQGIIRGRHDHHRQVNAIMPCGVQPVRPSAVGEGKDRPDRVIECLASSWDKAMNGLFSHSFLSIGGLIVMSYVREEPQATSSLES